MSDSAMSSSHPPPSQMLRRAPSMRARKRGSCSKQAKEAAEAEERRDTEAHLAKDEKTTFGTLADLLRPKR